AAGVRLDVGMVDAEQLLGKVAGQILDLVDYLATAIVALAGIAFGILVCQTGAHGVKHRAAGVVLAWNHLQTLGLACGFFFYQLPDIIVDIHFTYLSSLIRISVYLMKLQHKRIVYITAPKTRALSTTYITYDIIL